MKLFDEIPYLENDRLVLKQLTEKDAPKLAEMTADEQARTFLPAFLYEYGFEDKKEAIRGMYRDLFPQKENLFLGIYLKPEADELAGIVEIYNYVPYWNKASLGYRLSREYWGQGIAGSAASLILDYLMNRTDIKRVTAHVCPENLASSHVLTGLGFSLRKKGKAEDWGFEQPRIVDKYIYEKWGEIAYQKIGNGKKPMVILPGLSLQSTLGEAEAISMRFAGFSDYTIYLFDDRDGIGPGYTLRERAGDVAIRMRALGIENACVYGASMGGMVGLYLAMDAPKLVEKLFLSSVGAEMKPSTERVVRRWKELAEAGDAKQLNCDMLKMACSEETEEKYSNLFFGDTTNVTDEDLKKFILLTEAILEAKPYEGLDRIKCPVCLVRAMGDRITMPEACLELSEKLDCPLITYGTEYGHAVYDEAPDHDQKMLEFFEHEE